MKIKDITPSHMKCILGACPAIYKTDKDSYIIVGKLLSKKQLKKVLRKKLGNHEVAVEIPKQLLSKPE
ncbi:MAG: hypothetical protein WBB67_11815 [bacterium]